MTTPSAPSTIRAWQYTDNTGPLEKRLRLQTVALPQPKPDEHLVKILYAALNPVDYKPAEIPIASRFAIPKPATPGVDFAGRIITPATGSSLQPGQLVFGAAGSTPFAGGALREVATSSLKGTVAVPQGVRVEDASGIGVAALTAYQSIAPHVRPGDLVFINGGSGGVGCFGIQIAKALGCRVTATCSTPNVELCKSLGADAVIDYKRQPVLETLAAHDPPFSHVVDNVGSDLDLYFDAHRYTRPGTKFVFVGATPSLGLVVNMIRVAVPGFLGGGKRQFVSIFAQTRAQELEQIATWMAGGKVRAVIDSRWAFEDVPRAIERSKAGRARGKIVIDVAGDGTGKV